MARKNNPQYVIKSYQRKRRFLPFLIWGIAALIFASGVLLIVFWFNGSGQSTTPAAPEAVQAEESSGDGFNPIQMIRNLFASQTPTPTNTPTYTPTVPTATPTITPTETMTPTVTYTVTPEGPQKYTVEEGDNCWYIATEKFKVPMDLFLAINNFTMSNCSVSPGQEIIIPAPDMKLPTETPISLGQYSPGQQIEYTVKLNDSMREIVSKFNTTYEDVVKLNELTDANESLRAGQVLLIPVNLVTPTPTPVPTFTQIP